MTGEIESQPEEIRETGVETENNEQRKLDDATFRPGDYLEQTGDYKQAEVIQSNLELVMASLTTERVPDGEPPRGREQAEVSQVTQGSGADAVSDMPMPIPRPAGESSSEAEQVGDLPMPLPRPAGETGDEEQKEIPTPLARPAGETGDEEQKEIPTPLARTAGETGDEEQKEIPTPLARPAGETGDEEQIKDMPTPLPRTEDEIGSKSSAKESAGSGEIRLPGTAGEGMRMGETATIDQLVVRTEAAIEERSQSFYEQYLMLQNKISHENRQFSMLSNIMKTKHDTAKNSINNIR